MKGTFKSALNTTAPAAFASVTLLGSTPLSTTAVFAKHDGIDGKSSDADHDNADELEIKGGANPFRDDADEDLDGDGQSNRQYNHE